MRFTKMHGLGNDYVYIDCFEETINDPSRLAKAISDRHFGIGSDGLVLIMPSNKADFRMRMFNSDGSEAEMCGNAIRCVGKYVYDNDLMRKEILNIETLAGIKTLELTIKEDNVELVRVDMGEPILEPEKIPVISKKEIFKSEPVIIGDREFKVTCVSMGNPHAVTFIDDVESFPLEKIGPKMENHEILPKSTKSEIVKVIDRKP